MGKKGTTKVTAKDIAKFGDGGIECYLIDVCEHDVHPRFRPPLRHGSANTAPRSCNNCSFSGQIFHDVPLKVGSTNRNPWR